MSDGTAWGLLFIVYIVPFSLWGYVAAQRAFETKTQASAWPVVVWGVGMVVLYGLREVKAPFGAGLLLVVFLLLAWIGHLAYKRFRS